MKIRLNRLTKGEKGQVFVVVIILMLVASLLITPLLTYMYSGRIATLRNEVRLKELYAADAGIEYGMQLIKQKTGVVPPLPIANGEKASYSPLEPNLNDRIVGSTWITCENITNGLYRIKANAITSVPTTPGTGIDSLVRVLTFKQFTENAITSRGDVELLSNTHVYGTIQVKTPPGDLKDHTGEEEMHPQDNTEVQGWPTDQQMIDFYMDDVTGAPAFPYGNPVWVNSLPATNPNIIGPNYYDGDLTIDNKVAVGSLYLDNTTAGSGTLYVNGDIVFAHPNKAYTIHLNGQTIFATGEITALSKSITFEGPGAIIALGNITFQPQLGGTDFIFVMSVDGSVDFAPWGTFFGSVAGNVEVKMHPGYQFTWNPPVPELNVPWQNADRNIISEIVTWDIGSFSAAEPFIITSSLPDGGFGVAYSESLVGMGGTTPYTWDVISGSLPDGLDLDDSTGLISGTPTEAGLFPFEVRLEDAGHNSVTKDLSINVKAVTITSSYLLIGHVDRPYFDTLVATGEAPPYTWSVISGALPPGLNLDPSSGVISGTPTTANTYSLSAEVTDNVGNTDSKAFSITIHALPVVTTNPATNVQIVSATLNGSLNDLGSETGVLNVFFEWGEDTSYGRGPTPGQPMTTTGTATANIIGLSPNTKYHFRVVVLTYDGITVNGLDQEFQTQ